MKKDTTEQIDHVCAQGVLLAREYDIDPGNDDFSIIQAYDDGQAIHVRITGEAPKRKIKVNVTDTMIVLPSINGTLDVFGANKEDDEQ